MIDLHGICFFVSVSVRDGDPRKLFVGGLKSETNKEALHAHFERYGTVAEARVMYDWSNGKSRRFGFVTFGDTAAASRALDPGEKDNHIIDGHKVDVKQAVLKETRTAGPSRNSSSNANVPNGKKIFVGGLPTDIIDDEFRAYFEKFGPITDAVVLKDKNINQPRGFGFVTFETEESTHRVLENQFHEMRPDKKVEVKKAIPKIEGSIPRDNNNNNDNGISSNNNDNLYNGGKYIPGISKFPPDEYTYVVNYPVQFCDYTYPYTWYTPMVYGPMGYGLMGYGPINYGGWNCTNPNITWYDGQTHPDRRPGVPLSASKDDLKNHFGRYGQVRAVLEDEQEMPQDSDGKQACIFFADSASANRASASREKNNHIILGKLVEVSRFSIWLQHRRIKVYNLPPGTTSSQFRAYFEEFGMVTEAVVGPDGSGYVVFKWDESLRKVLKKKLHLFYGTELKARRESWGLKLFWSQMQLSMSRPAALLRVPMCSYPPFGTPYESSFDNRPISVTTYAYGAPSISPYGVPATSFYNSSTTATPHGSSAPTPSFGTPYTPSDNRPISVTTYAHGAPSISPYSVPSTSFYNWSTTATPHGSSAPTPSFGTPYTSSDNRPISVTTYAYGAPSISSYGVPATSLNNWSTTSTPHVDVETRTAGPSRNSSNNANVSNSKKIFVGGVPRDITYGEFRAYFEKFGPITNAFVPIDKNINRSRGFGFVTFETEESAHEVLKNQFHKMRPDKKVEVKKAIPMIEENIRCDNNNNDNGVSSSSNNIIDGHQVDVNVPNDKKIFVGGLPTDITDDEFWAYFGKFGLITDAFVVKDKIDLVKDKNIYRPRGFGFVTFETKESANEVLKNQFHEMRPGKKVEVKKAIP
uniref:RRM domain-containing protein n=1 Tax=Ananas comosus var. bracteatus TaxID=296719 RepID=A0A6V7PBE8_ANACO|nr:unnamed protein product [Ananas comosus var. bracteatus]